MMNFIKGYQKTCLVDYPGKVCSTIFLAKCNFKCGYCHNKDLVLDYELAPEIEQSEVLDFLTQKKKWLDGICITGGEPCLHGPNLIAFVRKVKKTGLLVKLDTNGMYPAVVKELLDNNLLDYVAVDIKAPLQKYELVIGVKFNEKPLLATIEILKNSKVDHEFRTTIIPQIFTIADIEEIGKLLTPAKKFCIQNFRADKELIDPKLRTQKPYNEERLLSMKKAAEPYFENVEIRNI